jgi:glucose-1-phosphate thymidylyltransferase
MQQADEAAMLTAGQRRAADAGLKALMPIHGRPFLEFGLSALADAGITAVALVVAPDHERVARYLGEAKPGRLHVDLVVQAEALGTARAILASESWTAGEPFLALNADNVYPVAVLRRLAALDEPALPVFEREELIRTSNIPAGRVQSFALLEVSVDGYLAAIVEKPAPEQVARAGSSALVSMNCWRFDRRIFEACRRVPRSARGEYELPEAVGLALALGVRFRTFPAGGPVIDLSRRGDAASAEALLAGITPRL